MELHFEEQVQNTKMIMAKINKAILYQELHQIISNHFHNNSRS